MRRVAVGAFIVLMSGMLRTDVEADDLDAKLRLCLGDSCVRHEDMLRCLDQLDPVIDHLRKSGTKNIVVEEILKLRCEAIEKLVWNPDKPCQGLTVENVAIAVERLSQPTAGLIALDSGKKPNKPPALLFSVGREVLDDLDPLKKNKAIFPAMVSYSNDLSAEREQVVLNGAAEVGPIPREIGQWDVGWSVGVEGDVNNAKPASETDVSFSLPVAALGTWTQGGPLGLESVQFALKPSYQTDRVFVRRAYEVSFSTTVCGPLGAGFVGSKYGIRGYGLPKLFVEVGDVSNANGNEKLAALEAAGGWLRVGGAIRLELWREVAKHPVALKSSYALRYQGPAPSWSPLLDVAAVIALDPEEYASIAVTYRDGRKPPSLTQQDQWLVGLGIKL